MKVLFDRVMDLWVLRPAVYVGLMLLVMVSACQNRVQKQPEPDDNSAGGYWGHLEYNQLLGTDIPKGSWWTDGEWYYEVKQTGKDILLEGYTLHEGGGVCAFRADGDSTLYIAKPREGYTTFAEIGGLVTHHLLKDEKGDSLEMLIAYDEKGEMPVAALQRFDGDELRFELGYIHECLAATYESDEGDDASQAYRWLKFNSDGTVQSSPGESPRPYEIELAYHMPTNVLAMPGGERIGVEVGIDSIHIFKAVYNDDEEYWESSEQRLAALPAKSRMPHSLKYQLIEMFNNIKEEQ